MNVGVLLREIYRFINTLELPPTSTTPMCRLVEREMLQKPQMQSWILKMVTATGAPADRHVAPDALQRAVGVSLLYCAGQLADDMADHEVAAEVVEVAPLALFDLLLATQLAFAEVVPARVVTASVRDFLHATAGAHVDLTTPPGSSSLELVKYLADRLGGSQFSSYLRLLWHDTDLEARAPEIGRVIGTAIQTAEELRSKSARVAHLSASERRELARWAFEQTRVPLPEVIGSFMQPIVAALNAEAGN